MCPTYSGRSSSNGLYGVLGVEAEHRPEPPSPSTTLTATIETVDNDRAVSAMLGGTGLPLP